jgi:hypothetical protein
MLSCEAPTGLEPTRSGISGSIFFKGDWPEQTDQVIVVASTVFPPTSLVEIVMSEPLDTNVDTAHYTIWENPADFAAIGVVWKEKDQPWDVTNIIGIYFPTDDHFSPGKVSIPDKETLVDSINIEANLSLARRKVDSTIEGTLKIAGDWPDNAQTVLMIASKTILPTSLLDIIFGAPIDVGFDSTEYSLSVQPNTYRLIGALLIQEDEPIGFDSIKGVYKKKPSDFFPSSVNVPTDTSRATGINITIDFESGLLP